MALMYVYIYDDFEPEKILRSGQCFRIKRFGDKEDPSCVYRFITKDRVLYLRRAEGSRFEVSCSPREWTSVWEPYFDLQRDYRLIRLHCRGKNAFIDRAMDVGRGLRILRQDPWEMLVTFIISQRKSIPAIATSVKMLARQYGRPVEAECAFPVPVAGTDCGTDFLFPSSAEGQETAGEFLSFGKIHETLYTFPTPAQLQDVTEEEFRACALGYRAPYIMDAVRQTCGGEIDPDSLGELDDETIFTTLQKIRGVGKKVANCICLFGYGRTSCVPVDVWISRAIEQECGGCDPFGQFGAEAGIMQQYVFYYKKQDMPTRTRRARLAGES